MLTAIATAAFLSACGGGGAGSPGTNVTPTLAAGVVVATPAPAPAPAPAPTPPLTDPTAPPPTDPTDPTTPLLPPVAPPIVPPTVPEPTPPAGALPDFRFANTGPAEQLNLPVTFGQVFIVGQFPSGKTLVGKLSDGTSMPLQVDVKAKHADGSVRHAIISGFIPALAAGASTTLTLSVGNAAAAAPATAPAKLLAAGFTAGASIKLDGTVYKVSADDLLRSGNYTTWLSGAAVNEWHVWAPLTSESGTAHPHLTARFAIRAYSGVNKAQVDVTIENNWAYEAAPQNLVYDATLTVGGQVAYTEAAMTHFHHARWRKVFWWGEQPQVHIKHNAAYLIATRAVPNYDQTVVATEATLAGLINSWTGTRIAPMGVGLAQPYMPTTGGRRDIGIMPGWAVTYLLSQDKRAKLVTLGTADLAGSFSSHYRDKNTGRPVSLANFPYMTLEGTPNDTLNPATKQREGFPPCVVACTSPNRADTSHQPGFAYLPYLVTGDYYYLEELQFWAMYNAFTPNPYYRNFGAGLVKSDQVRAQAWSMRTLAEVTYITPDGDPLKAQFKHFLDANLDWFTTNYPNNPDANTLGIITNGYALVYNGGMGMAPWMDDFFTAALGHAVELGFDNAKPMLVYKSKFPIARMVGAGACWIDGAIYSLNVRSTTTATTLYPSIKEAYEATHTAEFNQLGCNSTAMAASLKLKVGEMTGYAGADIGYPSNMQPALAYSADVGGAAGANAWSVFASRSVKPDYRPSPQFAIVPR
jgi:hypothetical protein